MNGTMRAGLASLAMALSGLMGCQAPNQIASLTPPPALTLKSQNPAPIAEPLASTIMPAGTATSDAMPAAYADFCARQPDQCRITPGAPLTVSVNPANWALLVKINSDENTAIKPMTDADHYGVADYWTIPTDGYVDCEDYALAKRKLLAEAGLPLGALRIAVVIDRQNSRHAVLTVATDRGDYVLDNITSEILPWTNAGFIWLARQDPAGRWLAINAIPTLVAARDAPRNSIN